jgi:SnoaL-like polyketide cyclase
MYGTKPEKSKAEIAMAFLKELEAGKVDKAASKLSTNFSFSSSSDLPSINKAKYMTQMREIKKAFPDWSFNPTRVKETKNGVSMMLNISATHKGDLNTFVRSLGVVKATGKSFKLPGVPMHIQFNGDQIVNIIVDSEPRGCAGAVLRELGCELRSGWQFDAEIPVKANVK